jgi:hypothetical protein
MTKVTQEDSAAQRLIAGNSPIGALPSFTAFILQMSVPERPVFGRSTPLQCLPFLKKS